MKLRSTDSFKEEERLQKYDLEVEVLKKTIKGLKTQWWKSLLLIILGASISFLTTLYSDSQETYKIELLKQDIINEIIDSLKVD